MKENFNSETTSGREVSLEELSLLVHSFVAERGWCSGHNPKNIAMAVCVEAGELAEIFQWLTIEESSSVGSDEVLMKAASEELADILILVLSFCNGLGIDIAEEVKRKIKLNAAKYPLAEFRGRSSARVPKVREFACWACHAESQRGATSCD